MNESIRLERSIVVLVEVIHGFLFFIFLFFFFLRRPLHFYTFSNLMDYKPQECGHGPPNASLVDKEAHVASVGVGPAVCRAQQKRPMWHPGAGNVTGCGPVALCTGTAFGDDTMCTVRPLRPWLDTDILLC